MQNWVKKVFQGQEGQVVAEMKRIRVALEIIALHFAKADGRMWHPEPVSLPVGAEDEVAEVLHTDDAELSAALMKEQERFQYGGWQE